MPTIHFVAAQEYTIYIHKYPSYNYNNWLGHNILLRHSIINWKVCCQMYLYITFFHLKKEVKLNLITIYAGNNYKTCSKYNFVYQNILFLVVNVVQKIIVTDKSVIHF